MGVDDADPIARPADPPGDPSAFSRDPGGTVSEYVDLVADLREAVSGTVRFDEYGLKFAPDPASSNRSTVGGGIGNNSTGAHS
ncbi:hypothetical protein BRD09_06155, partial [Halobacteriales archaeon SW_10_68_16]